MLTKSANTLSVVFFVYALNRGIFHTLSPVSCDADLIKFQYLSFVLKTADAVPPKAMIHALVNVAISTT